MGRSAHAFGIWTRLKSALLLENREVDPVQELSNESGQTATEYALVLSLVSIACAIALAALSDPFTGLVARVVETITNLV